MLNKFNQIAWGVAIIFIVLVSVLFGFSSSSPWLYSAGFFFTFSFVGVTLFIAWHWWKNPNIRKTTDFSFLIWWVFTSIALLYLLALSYFGLSALGTYIFYMIIYPMLLVWYLRNYKTNIARNIIFLLFVSLVLLRTMIAFPQLFQLNPENTIGLAQFTSIPQLAFIFGPTIWDRFKTKQQQDNNTIQ